MSFNADEVESTVKLNTSDLRFNDLVRPNDSILGFFHGDGAVVDGCLSSHFCGDLASIIFVVYLSMLMTLRTKFTDDAADYLENITFIVIIR